MSASKWTWVVLGVLYVGFFSWYTSFAGPLTAEEIEHYMELIVAQEGSDPGPERLALIRDFLESDTGDDFVMWNVIDLHDAPLQVEGVEPGQTSQEVVAKYMEFMFPALLKRACHPVIFGSAASPALEMFGMKGVREWDQAAGMRYRSRRDMLDIVVNPAFRGSHNFKIAGMKKSFAFPIDPWTQLGDPRLVLALVLGLIGSGVEALSARGRAGAEPADAR